MRADPAPAPSLDSDEIEAPVCIVGGGPLGLAVSIGLTAAKIEHVLLESGGEEVGDAQALAGGRNIDMRYFDPLSARIRALGGTTHVWGGHSGPMAPIDFERRDWIANSGWPIGFEDYRPWVEPAAETLSMADRWAADEVAPDHDRLVDDTRGLFDL